MKKKARLTKEEQDKILKLFNDNILSIKELAKQFNRSISGIRNILNNGRSIVINHRNLYGRNELRTEDHIDEIWKPLKYDTVTKYEISNYGRIKSYAKNPEGKIINGKMNAGYLQLDFQIKGQIKGSSSLVHRLVAMHFLPPPTENQTSIIHLDGNKANNRANNLKWVTRSEASAFGVHVNPEAVKERRKNKTTGVKLTLGKVEMIRKLLADPDRKTRKKMIAKQFGISEMTLYRIQNGEMWGDKGTPIKYEKKSKINILNTEKVAEIKKHLAENKLTQKIIAQKLGVSESVISRIKKGKTYKDFTG